MRGPIPRRPTILIVDDAPENIDILKGMLVDRYAIRLAINGRSALKAATIEPRPDLILLDVMMPEMDGYEVCRLLKDAPLTREIPVIFVTAKSEEEDELHGLSLGAVDYVTKPFLPAIVLARVQTHLSLRDATRQLAEHNHQLLAEREMIEGILLRMRQADLYDPTHLRSLVAPVEETAGDLLLSAFTPDGRQLVLLGDFTGHGLSAAVGGPLVAYIFQSVVKAGGSASELMEGLNDHLQARLPSAIFFAACLVEVAPERRLGLVFNAGLPGCLLLRNGVRIREIDSQSLPLGIVGGRDLAQTSVSLQLEEGDRLYMFSDGIPETCSPGGEMFGNDRLEKFLADRAVRDHPLSELLDELRIFGETDRRADDLTLVEIRA